jgi:hypothetical protein
MSIEANYANYAASPMASHGYDPRLTTHATQMSAPAGGPIVEIWEPTYAMKPALNERFLPANVEQIIKTCMEKKLRKQKFEDQVCKVLAVELCSEIKEKVKELNIPRYKVVLQSVIGEVKGQGAHIASRCLWDTETDNYASFSMRNSSLFCTVMVFGCYLE